MLSKVGKRTVNDFCAFQESKKVEQNSETKQPPKDSTYVLLDTQNNLLNKQTNLMLKIQRQLEARQKKNYELSIGQPSTGCHKYTNSKLQLKMKKQQHASSKAYATFQKEEKVLLEQHLQELEIKIDINNNIQYEEDRKRVTPLGKQTSRERTQQAYQERAKNRTTLFADTLRSPKYEQVERKTCFNFNMAMSKRRFS